MGYKGIQTDYLPTNTVYMRNNPDSVRARTLPSAPSSARKSHARLAPALLSHALLVVRHVTLRQLCPYPYPRGPDNCRARRTSSTTSECVNKWRVGQLRGS